MAVEKDKMRGTWSFYGSYRDIQGVKHRYKRRGFKTKREAKEAEHIYKLEQMNKVPSITLNELMELYIQNYTTLGIKEATANTNYSAYKNHIANDLGAVEVAKLKTPLIDQWLRELAKKAKPDGTPYSIRTINKSKEVLSSLLSFAVRKGYIEYNPCHSVPSFSRPNEMPKQSLKFWELETFNQFINYVDNVYWKEVFMFMFWTGVREGELFALQWKDIDLVKGTAHICKTTTSKTFKGMYQITTPKTKRSIRTIDLQDVLLGMLKKRYEREKKKDGFTLDYFVFGAIRPLSRSQLARFLDKYIIKSGVPRITPHGFRHSHASLLIRTKKIDDQLIADRLGHTPAELRKTYAHIYKESRSELKSILNEIS